MSIHKAMIADRRAKVLEKSTRERGQMGRRNEIETSLKGIEPPTHEKVNTGAKGSLQTGPIYPSFQNLANAFLAHFSIA